MIFKCEKCEKEFEVKVGLKYRTPKYCSQKCYIESRTGKSRGPYKEGGLPRGPQSHKLKVVREKSTKVCETCGKEFLPRLGKQRFCSRPCLYAWLTGDTSPGWKGGRLHHEGYILSYAPDHPYSWKHKGYVPEHRLVMEEVLGRILEEQETVHHINGDREDNRPENLQVRRGRHGKGSVFVCGDCGSHNIISEEIKDPT